MADDRVTMIINDGPGKLKAWNALRLAYGLVGEHVPVYLFLLDDGVLLAKQNQQPPPGLAELNLSQKLKELLDLGVEVEACGVCATARGMDPQEVLPGVKIGSMVNLAKAVRASRHVLVF